MQVQNKTWSERIVHAVGFEAVVLLIFAPLGAWLLNRPVLEVGALAVILSTTAMVWNMFYNVGFDHFWPAGRLARTLKVRVLHAMGFEGGLILICVPVTAWMLDLTLAYAFAVEIGFLLFMLPYTMVYNWLYDLARERWGGRLTEANGHA